MDSANSIRPKLTGMADKAVDAGMVAAGSFCGAYVSLEILDKILTLPNIVQDHEILISAAFAVSSLVEYFRRTS